eukprot:CAMPEP_0172321822 /NCGR_PEP_ID=MMETSP1058-20130122/44382_1 /TAXON_ID=83371 /ORGANISM="Detonula confervacea, Strain CCMP 353" /LENGTH=414 /DNA_ID=CAMNT_0013037421 /DNA_START=185 /DNA_END=1426 /DNA_ORIENTATION=+
MFSLATGIYQSYFAPPKLSILIIGLDGSGKTALLERIKVTNINTRLGVGDNPGADAPSSLPASYTKGGAVAGIGTNRTVNSLRQPQRGGHQHEGGKPARLPPPLPPKQALKSRQVVENMLEDEFSSANVETIKKNGSAEAQHLLQSVPPPPLVAETDKTFEDGSKQGVSTNKKRSESANKPPLPPRHDATTKNTTSTPVPTKKNSFIELLRCPSPRKYSNSALGEEEEEYHDNNPAKDALEPWSTDYLNDYYVNYQEGEEFDVKQQRGGGGKAKKMLPLDRIRPTLGQNLAKLDLSGCKCSLFDLSGAEKMRPLWDRYYRDTDAIVYVVNAAEGNFTNLLQSRREFEKMCQHDALQRRVRCGLPILVFANQLDVAYKEYEASMEKANNERNGRGISWNSDEEDDFVGGMQTIME